MCDPISIGVTGLALAGIGTVVNYSMGIQAANQQAAQAQAAATFQSQQAQLQYTQQATAMQQQAEQQRALMLQQQSQFQTQQLQAMQQQREQQQFQLRQQAESQRLQLQQSGRAQQFQMSQQAQAQMLQIQQATQVQQLQLQQQAATMEQNQRLAFQQQNQQIRQQQEARKFQAEQAAKQANLQIEQMNAQLADRYTQQREAVRAERNQLLKKFETDKRVYQDSKETAQKQKVENASAANRAYVSEQAKLEGKRREAAFEAQSILAKSIGAKGTILASGRTGQSVGLLLGDVERQAGFQKAQQQAMLEQDRVAAIIGMDDAFEQKKAADAAAEAQVGFDPTMPYLPKMPEVPTFVGFEIPK